MMNIPNIRLLNQQLVSPQMSDVHTLVSHMGMVQAQDYRMMRWAVGIRMKHPSMRAFREAYDSGRIVRVHLFRCTWQLVPAEDLRWMLSLCSDKNKTAINGYLAGRGKYISDVEYGYANRLIEQVLTGHRSMCKSELVASLAKLGLSADAHTMSVYLRRAEQDGLICSGELDDRQNTYALVEGRIPATPVFRREDAVATLARKYFRSHSPATLDDFIWWTNLNVGECRQAIADIRKELHEETFGGTVYYIHQDCRIRGCINRTMLLPSYDEFLLGYKSRHHVLDAEFRHRAYSSNGLFYPVVVSGGRIVGNWHPQRKASFFRDDYETDISILYERYRRFMSGMP